MEIRSNLIHQKVYCPSLVPSVFLLDGGLLVDGVKHVLRLGLPHVAVGNQCRGELVAKRELEVPTLGLGLLGRGSTSITRFLGVLLALLERGSLVRLCLRTLIMVLRGGHVQTVDAAILRGMLGTPDKFATLVFDGVTFLGHLPLGATSLGRLLPVVCGTTALLLGRAGCGFTLEQDLLRERAILCLHIVDHGSERHNVSFLLGLIQEPSATILRCILSNFLMMSEEREMSSMIQDLLS